MNGSTIVSQVENWMTEVGEAGVRGFQSCFSSIVSAKQTKLSLL
jgi:hypothetical protein